MLIRLALQLIGLLSVSSIFGFWFTTFHFPFFIGFFVGLVLQVLGFYLYSNIIELIITFKAKKLEVEKLRELSYQSIEVECPCFKKIKSIIPYRFNTNNYYKCQECSKTISVFTSTETAVTTEPVLNTDVQPILQEKLKDANS